MHNAWLKTIEDGVHTYDIFVEGVSKQKVGTKEFADAVIERLGQLPAVLKPAKYEKADKSKAEHKANVQKSTKAAKETIGVDVFLHLSDTNVETLGEKLSKLGAENLKLKMITNRGVKVWPDGFPETFCVDHWRCRYVSPSLKAISHDDIIALLKRLSEAGFDFIKTENLCTFDGERSYSLGQGE